MAIRKRTWETKDGTQSAWQLDYKDAKGKRHKEQFKLRKQAVDRLTDIQSELKAGTHTPTSQSISVAEAAKLWLTKAETEGLEKSTRLQYANHADIHIVPQLGTIKLAKLTTARIEEFKDAMIKDGPSRSMARKVLVSLKSIIREAQRRGLVATNAALPVKVTAKAREESQVEAGVDFPTKAEAQLILQQAVKLNWPPLFWYPLFATLLLAGMRTSEVRGLTWGAVDFAKRVIKVRQRANLWGDLGEPKSKAGRRDISMSPIVVNALREWKLACPKVGNDGNPIDLVFPHDGGIVGHGYLQRGFNRLQRDAGIVMAGKKGRETAKYSLHALRHWYASYMIELNFSPKRLQALLGHNSIQVTFDIYGHLFPSLEDDQAKLAAGEAAFLSIVNAPGAA